MDGHTFTLVIWDSEAKEKVKMKYKPTLMNPAFCPLWTVWKWLVMSEKSRYETSLRFRPSRTSHLHCSGRPEQKQQKNLYLYIYPAFPYKNPQNNINWSVRYKTFNYIHIHTYAYIINIKLTSVSVVRFVFINIWYMCIIYYCIFYYIYLYRVKNTVNIHIL